MDALTGISAGEFTIDVPGLERPEEVGELSQAVEDCRQLLGDTCLVPQQREYAQIVSHSGGALVNTINDILDFSKLEAGNMSFERESFKLRELIAELVDLLYPFGTKEPVQLEFDYASSLPEYYAGDAGRVRQCERYWA
jgi:signal transduction histidine kinase